jgi:Trk K+ transport system NAD-binding subunit
VIVCGLSGVGARIVEQLHAAGVEVVVIDDEADARPLRGLGVELIEGNARLSETLDAAGLAGAEAVVCVESDDLRTLEICLLAREMRPDLRVVAQLRNPAVGRALAGARVAVLDVAALSAPAVVQVCRGGNAHPIELGGRRFVVTTVTVNTVPGGEASLRTLFGDVAPIGVLPADGVETVVCPGRDHLVRPGDAVTLFSTPEEADALGLPQNRSHSVPAGGARFRAGAAGPASGTVEAWARRVVASLFEAADRRLRYALLALAVLIVTATTVLHFGYHDEAGHGMSWLDAVYFTVETVGTIGYGDFSFRTEPSWLRVFAILLMFLGALLATVFFALLTNLLVSRRIEESLGRRRVGGLSGHTIVIGLGSIGSRVLADLRADGDDVVVIEAAETNRHLARARDLGVPVVVGDATLPETLGAANLPAARAVAVLTSDDLTNLETGLVVRDQLGARWPSVPVVLRLFDRRLAHTVGQHFGFEHGWSTAALAAPWFVGAALGLDIVSTFYVGTVPLLVGRLRVTPGGGLAGLAMHELSALLRVVAIRRADAPARLEHPPRRDTRFRAGDEAWLVGPYEELLAVLRRDTVVIRRTGERT